MILWQEGFFHFGCIPLDLRELRPSSRDVKDTLNTLMSVSGFPEPFVRKDPRFYGRWVRSHLDVILREDFLGLLQIRDIHRLRLLINLLRQRVGSPVSYTSLAEDLQVSHKSVKAWIELLEKLYILFKVTPYHKNIARSLLKEPKYYFYNTVLVKGGEEAVFENLVACSLHKSNHFLEDVQGLETRLHYLRTRDGQEVDFFTEVDGRRRMIEVKLSDSHRSKGLAYFSKFFADVERIQLVKNLGRNLSYPDGLRVVAADKFLGEGITESD